MVRDWSVVVLITDGLLIQEHLLQQPLFLERNGFIHCGWSISFRCSPTRSSLQSQKSNKHSSTLLLHTMPKLRLVRVFEPLDVETLRHCKKKGFKAFIILNISIKHHTLSNNFGIPFGADRPLRPSHHPAHTNPATATKELRHNDVS